MDQLLLSLCIMGASVCFGTWFARLAALELLQHTLVVAVEFLLSAARQLRTACCHTLPQAYWQLNVPSGCEQRRSSVSLAIISGALHMAYPPRCDLTHCLNFKAFELCCVLV